ncbi:hypothetical protein F5890DRAFT_1560594 [Lentinula detonsa]|uniref:Uncharacterized protein n=1 Tax=Lentinula detonsa TaxID=2804962 RepID=A0AA38UM22_9AGAR|nr:hypothetical protein F5890DRAFT_1560594 [Lentinula detonsa]
MGRRRRVDSDGLLPCQCQDCSKQNPEGMQITQQVFDEHRRRERLRKTLLNKSDGLRTDLETEPTKTDMAAGHYMDSYIRDKSGALERIASGSSPANTNNTQVISSSSSSAAEPATVEDDDYLRHIIYETRMRLETLYDDEIQLKFISPPSPEQQAFVFPDHQSLLRVNSGEFALKTTSACNRRLLDAEARFCGLLKTIQSKPPEERLLGDVDVEEELFEALNKVHRIKERQWRLQHISGDTIVENSMCALLSINVEAETFQVFGSIRYDCLMYHQHSWLP